VRKGEKMIFLISVLFAAFILVVAVDVIQQRRQYNKISSGKQK
jgi:dolichyl-phosphate-mannose--protein O-mannosyl transferase